MAATVIRNFIAKALFKKKGAIANNKSVEFSANALENRLKNLGIDSNAIQNENQLNEILAAVKQAEDQAFDARFGDMLGGSKFDRAGEVFDLTGKKLDSSRGIMGGTQIDETSLKEGLMKTDNPFSDLVNTPRPKTIKEREAEVFAAMEKNNKEAVQRIRNRKMVEEAIDNASPGFAGDRKYDAQLVADDLAEKRFGKDFYDLDQKQQMDLYDESFQGLSDSRFKNKPDPEDMATGGRAGFKEGSGMTRRSFLKILGGLAAVPIVGKFFKLTKVGKTVQKVPMIKTGDVPGKPEWFDQLVNKVIFEGDDVTKKFATQERQVVHMKKIDDDTSVTVTQDLNDGSIMVDVDDPVRNVMGEGAGLETDTKVQMMLKKGQADETTKGTPPDEFSFTENDMRNYMDGPDDYTTEFTENTVNKMSDLTSDLGKIKQYATGKGPTMKQIVESKKRKDMVKFAEENPSEYAANRGPEFDPDYDDYAAGGIARMLGE